jgi:hypothetical protein
MTEAYVDEGQMVKSGPFTDPKAEGRNDCEYLENNLNEPLTFALRIGVYLVRDIGELRFQ